jgi:type IV pilus assembly protein PilN
MTRINLLPWRETLRKEQQRQFISIAAGAAVLTAVIMIYIHIHINGMINAQTARNNFLENEVAEVDKKISEIKELETEKQQLLARMNIIQQLQRRRPEIVHVFDEMAKRVPDGIYLTDIKQQGQSLVIEGTAESNARVSAFMRNLDASDWFTNPRLVVIESKEKESVRTSKFTLNVTQVSPNSNTSKTAGLQT